MGLILKPLAVLSLFEQPFVGILMLVVVVVTLVVVMMRAVGGCIVVVVVVGWRFEIDMIVVGMMVDMTVVAVVDGYWHCG